MLQLPLAVGMIDVQVNIRQFDQGIAYIRAKLSTTPSVHNIAVNVNRASATSQINLLMQQMQAMRQQAAAPISVSVARRGVLGGTGGARAGGAARAIGGAGMGLMQGLGVAGFATSPAMMVGQMIGSGLREAVGTAMDLESTFVGLRQVTGESAGNVDRFKNTIFDISKKQAGVSVADVTGIAMAGAKAGISDKEGIAGLETFTRSMAKVKNAVGGGEGLGTEQLTEDMTRMMYLFGKDTGYIESMGSALVRMANISTASAGSIAEMTKALSGTTAALKLSFPETAAFASVLADAGLTAQQGASSFSQIFRSMASKPETFAGAAGVNVEQWTGMMNKGQLLDGLKLLADKFKEINATDPSKAQEWLKGLGFVGVRTAGAFQQVVSVIDKVAERVAAANEEEANLGALQAANELKSETAIANIQKLKNAFTELADTIGSKVVPHLTDMSKLALNLMQQMAGGKPGGPERLSFMEETQLKFMNMIGGEISPEFKARRDELNRRAEAFSASVGDLPLEAGPIKPGDLKPVGPNHGMARVPTPDDAFDKAMAEAAIPRDLIAQPLAGVGEEMARANDVAQANLIFGEKRSRGAGLTVGPGLLEKAKTSNIFDLIGHAQGLGDVGPGLLEKMAKGSSWPIPLKSPTDAAAAALAARGAVPKDREHIGVAISGEEMLKRFQEGALKGKDDIGEKQLAVQEKTLTAVEMLAAATKASVGGGIARLE